MGQSLKKLKPGNDEKTLKELLDIIDKTYDDNVKNVKDFSDFYAAVCQIVEELNKKSGHTQIKLPTKEKLKEQFSQVTKLPTEEQLQVSQVEKKNHLDSGVKRPSKTQFQEIMKDLLKNSGFTGVGAKEAILFIFGVPMTALFVKERVMPQAVPNEYLIPGATSLTVFTLAALNKI